MELITYLVMIRIKDNCIVRQTDKRHIVHSFLHPCLSIHYPNKCLCTWQLVTFQVFDITQPFRSLHSYFHFSKLYLFPMLYLMQLTVFSDSGRGDLSGSQPSPSMSRGNEWTHSSGIPHKELSQYLLTLVFIHLYQLKMAVILMSKIDGDF